MFFGGCVEGVGSCIGLFWELTFVNTESAEDVVDENAFSLLPQTFFLFLKLDILY